MAGMATGGGALPSAASLTASPASVGGAAAAGGGNVAGFLDLMADDVTFTMDRKAETEQALLEDLVGSLCKEKQKLEEDVWRYAAPRSQPKLIS